MLKKKKKTVKATKKTGKIRSGKKGGVVKKKKEKKVLVIIGCPPLYTDPTDPNDDETIRSHATTEVYLTGYEENGERHKSLKEWLENNTEHTVEELIFKYKKNAWECNIQEICEKIDKHSDCEVVYLSVVGHGDVKYPGGKLLGFGRRGEDLLYLNKGEKNLKDNVVKNKKYSDKKFHFNFCACHLGRAIPELIEPENAIAGHGYDKDFWWCADIGNEDFAKKMARKLTEAHLTVDRTLLKKGEKGWATHSEADQECKKEFKKILYLWSRHWRRAFWLWLSNWYKVYTDYKTKKVYPSNTDATIWGGP
jgi:hypothetical protein